MDNEDSNHPSEINNPETPINVDNSGTETAGAANAEGPNGEDVVAKVQDQKCGEYPSQDIINILDGLDNHEDDQPSIEQFNLEEVSKFAAIANLASKTSTKFEVSSKLGN